MDTIAKTNYDIPLRHFFKELTENEFKHLENNCLYANYKPKNIIFKQNTPATHVYFIKSGFVQSFYEKEKTILKISGPGEIQGITSFFDVPYYKYDLSAITEVNVVIIEIKAFLAAISNNTCLASKIYKAMAKESDFFQKRLLKLTKSQLPGKVAETLLYFYNLQGCVNPFKLLLSRADLARFAGTSKESFIRTLSELKNDRIISIDNRTVKIESMDIIEALARLG